MLTQKQIRLVLDVGASTGAFASQIRSFGYQGRIVSFEPLSESFMKLRFHAAADPKWECRQLALGNRSGECEINVAGNLHSSSFLPMNDSHARAAPKSKYVGTEKVMMERLDTVIREDGLQARPRFLKIDSQGYEMEILRGASVALETIDAIEIELSLVSLYEGQPLFLEMIDYLSDRGFELVGLDPIFHDPSSARLLQVDGLFVRKPAAVSNA